MSQAHCLIIKPIFISTNHPNKKKDKRLNQSQFTFTGGKILDRLMNSGKNTALQNHLQGQIHDQNKLIDGLMTKLTKIQKHQKEPSAPKSNPKRHRSKGKRRDKNDGNIFYN